MTDNSQESLYDIIGDTAWSAEDFGPVDTLWNEDKWEEEIEELELFKERLNANPHSYPLIGTPSSQVDLISRQDETDTASTRPTANSRPANTGRVPQDTSIIRKPAVAPAKSDYLRQRQLEITERMSGLRESLAAKGIIMGSVACGRCTDRRSFANFSAHALWTCTCTLGYGLISSCTCTKTNRP